MLPASAPPTLRHSLSAASGSSSTLNSTFAPISPIQSTKVTEETLEWNGSAASSATPSSEPVAAYEQMPVALSTTEATSSESTSSQLAVTSSNGVQQSDSAFSATATSTATAAATSPHQNAAASSSSSNGSATDTTSPPAVFDPLRSQTPPTISNSPILSGEPTPQSTPPLPLGSKNLPILSLPALAGQRVCPCMRAVEESMLSPIQPTSTTTQAFPLSSTSGAPATSSYSVTPASSSSFLSLQDRFWLSVGEIALVNHDHSVERGIDHMETLVVKLTHLVQQLHHTRSYLHSEQLRGVETLMMELEKKNSELISQLKQIKHEETCVRDRIEVLSTHVDKAKKTVSLSGMLGLSFAKQEREESHLATMRQSRDIAQSQLDALVTQRNATQDQMLNVSTIAAECRINDMDKRDYKLMYKQVQSANFHRSFGRAYQSQVDTLVKVLAKFREQSHECSRRQRLIEHTIHELRGRIALIVSAYWK